MKTTRLYLIFSLLISTYPFHVQASHVLGGEITWTCIGHDSFLLKINGYRECFGPDIYINPLNIYCVNGSLLSTHYINTISAVINILPICSSTCDRCQNPGCSTPYGVSQQTFYKLLVMNNYPCCEVKITADIGSRSITSTSSYNGDNILLEAILNRCINPCNNSPQPSSPPLIIGCLGNLYHYNMGAIDPDFPISDSITYELTSPSNYGTICSYNSPYSYDKPLRFWGFPNAKFASPYGFHLDRYTGDLVFTPMLVESTFMAIKIKKYRSGQKIGEFTREFAVIIINCPGTTANLPPKIQTAGNVKSFEVCENDTGTFVFNTKDPNSGDKLWISWNNALPNANWVNNNGQGNFPTATLKWKPDSAYFSATPYYFTIQIKDNNCPYNNYYSQAFQMYVKSAIKANYSATDKGAGTYYFHATPLKGSNISYKWRGSGGISSSFSSFHHKFNKPGQYPYTLTITAPNCCPHTYYDTIRVDSFFNVVLPADTLVCKGSQLDIKAKYYFSQGKVKFKWNTSPSDTLQSNKILITKDTTLIVSAADTCGIYCYDTMKISFYKITNFPKSRDTAVCYGDSVTLKAEGGNKYKWSTGDTTAQIKVFTLVSKYYFVEITDKKNCIIDDSAFVTIPSKATVGLPSNISICQGQPAIIYASGGLKYLWSTNDTANYIIIKPSVSQFYYVSIMDSNHCTASDSIFVGLLKLPTVIVSHDTSVCKGDSIILTASGADKYYWSNGDTNSTIMIKPIFTNGLFITVTDSNNCSSSDSVYITVYQPSVIITEKDTGTCLGKYILLHANGGLKYRWSTGDTLSSIHVSPVVSRYYRVTGIDQHNCPADDTVYVEVYAQPIVNFTANPISGNIPLFVNFTDITNLFSGSIDAYYWDFGDSTYSYLKNPPHTYFKAGVYSVKLVVVSDKGCTDSLIHLRYINALPSSIPDEIYDHPIVIIPNPAIDQIRIKLQNTNHLIFSVEMQNSQGKTIKTFQPINAREFLIDRERIPKGLYFLKIKFNDDSFSFRKVIFE